MEIKRFNEFKGEEELNEGWKEVVLGGLLSLLTVGASGQKGNYDYKTLSNIEGKEKGKVTSTLTRQHDFTFGTDITKKTADSTIDGLLKQGWSLDAQKLDTLWNNVVKEVPDTVVSAVTIKLDTAAYFPSGRFTLNDGIKKEIDNGFDSILKNNGTLIKIVITSSTDKQRVGQNLQSELKGMGLSGDNTGLSKARSNNLKTYICGKGVSDSIIEVENLSEQGTSEIEQVNRYVKIDLIYLETGAPMQITTREPGTVKYSATLHKKFIDEVEKDDVGKFRIKLPTIRIGKAGDFKSRGSVKCPRV